MKNLVSISSYWSAFSNVYSHILVIITQQFQLIGICSYFWTFLLPLMSYTVYYSLSKPFLEASYLLKQKHMLECWPAFLMSIMFFSRDWSLQADSSFFNNIRQRQTKVNVSHRFVQRGVHFIMAFKNCWFQGKVRTAMKLKHLFNWSSRMSTSVHLDFAFHKWNKMQIKLFNY